jgi:hypothetical protein
MRRQAVDSSWPPPNFQMPANAVIHNPVAQDVGMKKGAQQSGRLQSVRPLLRTSVRGMAAIRNVLGSILLSRASAEALQLGSQPSFTPARLDLVLLCHH